MLVQGWIEKSPMQLDRNVVSMSSEATAVAATCSSLYSISSAMVSLWYVLKNGDETILEKVTTNGNLHGSISSCP